jgi:RimJ/RimL family protein N-acetyltransferase
MFARTERLLLRPGFAEDAPLLADVLNDEGLARNLNALPWPYAADQAAQFLTTPQHPLLPRLLMVKRTSGTPRVIGGIGIDRQIADDGSAEFSFGYWIARRYWGLGFATEAGRAVLAMARTNGLPRLTASHFIDNQASGAVLRKLGFRPTGRIILRHSPARGGAAPAALFEEAGDCGVDAVGDISAMRCGGLTSGAANSATGGAVDGKYGAPARQLAA